MKTLSRFCDNCKKYGRIDLNNNMLVNCPHCSKEWAKIEDVANILERCPVCTCRQFYVDKDFNQILGFVIMGIGIVLVPFTYGLSLPVFALIDWIIYKKVPRLIACYRCGSEYRAFEIPPQLKPFMHHIGLKYDKYR